MDSNELKIGMISVLYNPSGDMIRKVFHNSQGVNKLIIVDNSDYSNEKLLTIFDGSQIDYVYIPNYRNVGLAKAINDGMQIISSLDFEWCLVYDQDSEAANDVLSVYKDYIMQNKADNIGVIGPQYDYDNRMLKPLYGEKERQWLMLSGCLVNVPVFMKIGGFNEGFFLDGLDVDYDYRLIEHKYKVVQCLGAVIYHCPGTRESISIFKRKFYYGVADPFRYYHQARAGIYNGLSHSKMYGIYELGRKLIKIVFLFNAKGRYLKMFRCGLMDGIYWYREKT